jgi:hypothetical protein
MLLEGGFTGGGGCGMLNWGACMCGVGGSCMPGIWGMWGACGMAAICGKPGAGGAAGTPALGIAAIMRVYALGPSSLAGAGAC